MKGKFYYTNLRNHLKYNNFNFALENSGECTLFLSMQRTSCTGLFSGLCGVLAACSSLLHLGRKCFNVLGALNAVSREVLTITNDRYLNSQSVCQLLLKIAEAVGHGAITLVLDNARYQKCKLVQHYAEILGIELLFLPA